MNSKEKKEPADDQSGLTTFAPFSPVRTAQKRSVTETRRRSDAVIYYNRSQVPLRDGQSAAGDGARAAGSARPDPTPSSSSPRSPTTDSRPPAVAKPNVSKSVLLTRLGSLENEVG